MANGITLVKIGGNDLETPGFVEQLAQTVAARIEHTPIVIVHGGGRSISAMQQRLGLEPVYVNGQRMTDAASLDVVEMMLSGLINKRLTLALLHAGVDALGMSGVDRGLLRVEPVPEMGRVGRIVAVRAEILHELCAQGVVPVISPVSMGDDGRYNVNADHAAGAIAAALDADVATFLTNVPGVQVGDDVAHSLTASEAQELITTGVINGGMIPKVTAALDAVAQGVRRAVITDLPGLSVGSGTVFTA